MVTANKGEWAELYAFLKVISEREIPIADENLAPIPYGFIRFINVHRALQSGKIAVFHLSEGEIRIESDEFAEVIIPASAVSSKTSSIFADLMNNTARTFELPEAFSLMESLKLHSIKAPSGQKADIVATVFDSRTTTNDVSGFSTKSFLGAAPTLLNPSAATLFRYRVKGIERHEIEAINEILGHRKLRDRLAKISRLGGICEFIYVHSPSFTSNLRKIDTLFPEFLAHMLLAYFQSKGPNVTTLIDDLAANSSLVEKYNLTRGDLAFKFKSLLINIALGLKPDTIWDGLERAHGGFLIVKMHGEVVCYMAVHRDRLLQYLFDNTQFDTPSTKPGKNSATGYGFLFEQDDSLFLDLQLQIRFKKP